MFMLQGELQMKINHVIVFLLILLGVSAYGEGRVRGFETNNCSGNFLEVRSLGVLGEYHEHKKEIFGKTWYFKSYLYVDDSDQTCHKYDLEEIEVIGQRLPGSSSGSGVSGGGSSSGSGGSQPSQPSHGVGGPRDPADEFTDEMNEQLKDCWVEDLDAIESVTNWEGEETGSTWSNDPDASWTVDPTDRGTMGVVNSDDEGNIMAYIFPTNIRQVATSRNIVFQHMVLYAQMHEYVHVLQWTHYQNENDGDDPPPYEYFDMERENYNTVNDWWRARFDSGPPILSDANTRSLPRGFRNNQRRYEELEAKLANGESLTSNEQAEMDQLAEWFNNAENLPGILDGQAGGYDPDLDFECDVGESE